MNLGGLMSLAQSNWKKDWLKFKWSFLRVNHQWIMQGPVRKPKEVFDRAQRQTRQIQNKLLFLTSFIYIALVQDCGLRSHFQCNLVDLHHLGVSMSLRIHHDSWSSSCRSSAYIIRPILLLRYLFFAERLLRYFRLY